MDLLRYYASEWDRYTRGANYLNRLFTYLNRYWVKRERDEGKKGVYQVYTVSFAPWSFIAVPETDPVTSWLWRNGRLISSCTSKKTTQNSQPLS